jgi:hypothetical protein
MKMKCFNEFCTNETKEGYKYCVNCAEKWKSKTKIDGKWNDDPIIDNLMKINSNLGQINITLREMCVKKVKK